MTDFGRVEYVADPFGCKRDRWYVFFEMYNRSRDPDAAIGYATSEDGYDWEYGGIALETAFHLSFPFVFEHDGRWFMTPEQEHPDGPRVSLYESTGDSFPEAWVESAVLLKPDHEARDPVIFEYNDRWWLLVADTPTDELYLYSAPEPTATDWRPHPENPVGTHGQRAARPGGRPLVSGGRLILFYQDCTERYGHAVRAFEVTELTDETFAEQETAYSPVLSPTSKSLGWNSGCMHTFDAQRDGDRWLCIVDGNTDFGHRVSDAHWSIGVYESRDGGGKK